jgi:hypothetical protein
MEPGHRACPGQPAFGEAVPASDLDPGKRTRPTAWQIIRKLKTAQQLIAQGKTAD